MKNLICFLMVVACISILFSGEKSIDSLIKAAEQGDAEAQNNLGLAYYNGQGVTQDYVEAVKWWRKAAEQDLAEAQNNLGNRYAGGQGVKQDYVEAVKWWRKAAKQSNANAQYKLGLMYADGWGVKQDYISSYMWHDIATSNGNKLAAFVRDHLAKEMTSDDIEQAKKQARICLESNYEQCD
jgi:tetratricopeptide (TPR) repeat protein